MYASVRSAWWCTQICTTSATGILLSSAIDDTILLSRPRFAAAPLEKRAECGPGIGSCDPGFCCSESGNCGKDEDFCDGSSCQLDYSDSCDTFSRPPGTSTEDVDRPEVGDIPYGSIITDCTTPGLMALTFDDGPWIYTDEILDLLDELEVTATFFIAGNNRGKGHIDDESTDWPDILRRMHDAGHQLASHTWTHRSLDVVNSTIRKTEIVYNEMAFRNVLGFFPTYLRPPYLECGSACQSLLGDLGYHIITINVDTKDYENDAPELIQISKDRFSNGVSTDSDTHEYIELSHDVHEQTVHNLTRFMVDISRTRGYKLVTLGECLGDPKENWYRPAGGAGSATPTATGGSTKTGTSTRELPTETIAISPDQTCGGDTGYTCQGSKFGNCCSHYGYCGSGSAYCGTGCDVDFGSCSPGTGGTADTTNGLCGPLVDATCINYGTKTCCSSSGYCGNSPAYCGNGCQGDYGECN